MKTRRNNLIRAAAPPAGAEPERIQLTAPVEVIAAAPAADGKPAAIPRFKMRAYTGGVMNAEGIYYPVVLEMSGIKAASQSLPILRQHDPSSIVGHTDNISVTAAAVDAEGVISGTGPHAQEVLSLAKNGFPWQASIGAAIDRREFLEQGKTAKINGQSVTGPLILVRAATLREISFVPLGADPNTSAAIAANPRNQRKEHDMKFAEWLQAKGFDIATLSQAQRDYLQAQYEAENPAAPPAKTAPAADENAIRASERERIGLIDAAVAKVKDAPGVKAEMIDGLRADAVAGKIDLPALQAKLLDIVRENRPKAPAAVIGRGPDNTRVLQAAMALKAGLAEKPLVAAFGADTMESAHRYRRMGLRDLIRACVAIDGGPQPDLGASERELVRAAFSTTSFSGILSATANKVLMASYEALPPLYRRIARRLTASDFKTHTGYWLTGDPTMEKVGADGALKYGNLGDASFTYRVETYGKVFGLTRQDIINDDLGAFLEIPRIIGRGAGLAIEDAGWTLVLANTNTFFGAGNNNYIEGAGTVLGSAGLGSAVEKLLKQTDRNSKPILLDGRYLVVPPELKVTADELYQSTNINTGGSSSTTKVPNRNIFAGKYEPIAVPYLSNTGYSGYSTTAFYLFPDPENVAAFGLAFLNGAEQPVVEEVDQAPEFLGTAFRGYIDFGVCQVDPRGGVKSKGAA